jgi:hypothetical protein
LVSAYGAVAVACAVGGEVRGGGVKMLECELFLDSAAPSLRRRVALIRSGGRAPRQ